MTIRARLGQRYRVTSASFPEYGIGTVIKVNSDLSGIMQNEEKGNFHFQYFDISPLSEDFDDLADESVKAILSELRILEVNGVIPVGTVHCFEDVQTYTDSAVLIRKHVPREDSDWLTTDLRSFLDDAVADRVSLWLSLGTSVMS